MAVMEEKNEGEERGGRRRKAQETRGRGENRRKNKETEEGGGGGRGRGEARITGMNENERKKGEEEEGRGGGGGGGGGGGEDITRTKERRRGRDKNTQIGGGGRGRGGGGRPGRLGRIWLLMLLILTLTLRTLAKHDTNTYDMDEDDDLSLALNLLYRESDDAIDPHDMLPGSREKVNVRLVSGGGQGSAAGSSGEGEAQRWVEECQGEERVAEELERCHEHLDTLRNSLEKEQIASLKLQKVLAKEGILDLQAFYRRAVQHLWNTLKLEEGQELLKDGNTAVMRQVLVRVSKDHITGLANYLETESDPHKVDEFFQQGFTLQDLDSDASPSLLHSLVTLVTSLVQAGKSLEVWLVILCVGFVALGLWAVVLFVRDIQKQLRWGRVLGMMATVMFFICCLWHWRHMYKMAESRRHAQLAKKGYTGIPEECQPGAKASVAASVYEWIRVRVFGSPDVCEQYFEELMIDSMEEITPGMVIAETLSRFIFQPLQHLGTESAKLTTNFYQTVPLPYHFHATFLFLGLLTVLLFFGCAYGVDFPLGLGGFSPKSRPEARSANAIDKDGLGQEVAAAATCPAAAATCPAAAAAAATCPAAAAAAAAAPPIKIYIQGAAQKLADS